MKFLQNQNRILLYLSLFLCAALVAVLVYRSRRPPVEGFTQSERFVVRRQEDVYDEFTAQIYDQLHQPASCAKSLFDDVEKLTQMEGGTSTSSSSPVILDVGCGTCELTHYIASKGYTVYGVDQSIDMIEYSRGKYADLNLKVGDVTHPSTYDRRTFSHIFMTGNTVYHFPDKVHLFRNLYDWLRPHGYLILQVCDRERFSTIPAAATPALIPTPQDHTSERILATDIDFVDFTYQCQYNFDQAAPADVVVLEETFTDHASRHVRKHEMTLHMSPLDQVIYQAQYAGFLVHGQMKVKADPHQYVFVLERPN